MNDVYRRDMLRTSGARVSLCGELSRPSRRAALGLLTVALLGVTPPANAALRPTCNRPIWTSTDPDGVSAPESMYTVGPFILHNNMWNAEGYDMTQTMSACSQRSWYVDYTTQPGTDTAVKTYPNVHVDYHNWSTGEEPRLSSFSMMTSSYAGHGAGVGVYNVAYDIWLNGVGGGANEVMIWTENHGQRPAGSIVAPNVIISGLTWDLWATSSNRYIAFVPTNGEVYASGTLDLMAFFDYLIQQGQIPSTSTLGQVGYGVEVVSSGEQTARFNCTNFSLRPLGPRP